jgi:hypothetical protein
MKKGASASVLEKTNIECEDCGNLLVEWEKKPDKIMY